MLGKAILPDFMRFLLNAVSYGKQWRIISSQERLLFVGISVRQTLQRYCRLDIRASLQHLHQSIFLVYQTGPEQICACIAKDIILKATIFFFVKEKLVAN